MSSATGSLIASSRAALSGTALRAGLARLREPRRALAVAIVVVGGGVMVAFLVARGSAAGADALAYWAGARAWLAGGDPYQAGAVILPYLYPPWLLPLFIPWALLPWDLAWFGWRAAMVILLLWSATWAYRRRPLATAVLLVLLGVPLAATLDTGNVTLFLALAVWAAQFTGPRLGGLLWALATAFKWIPAVLWIFLPSGARHWGLVFLAGAALLSLATWPQTLAQVLAAAASGPPNLPRPLRVDHLLLLWAAVPWLWRHDPRAEAAAARQGIGARLRGLVRAG